MPRINFLFKLFIVFLFFSGPSSESKARQSYFTISRVELQHGFLLDNRWEFYWNTDYTTYLKNSAALNTEYINLPNDWCSIGHPKKGYGLYLLPLVIPGIAGSEIGIDIPSVCNAYNFYINGSKFLSVGVFATQQIQSSPNYHPRVVTYPCKTDTLILAFEVSNYFYREGGLNYSIKIGEKSDIVDGFNKDLFITSFITGALVLMFFYFLGFYLIRRKEYAALYFALLCLVSALRIMSTGGILLRQLGLPISWEWLVKVELTSIVLVPTFGALFLFNLLNEKRYLKLLYLLNSLSLLMVLVLLFASPYIGSHIVPLFRYFALFECIFVLFVVVVNFITRSERTVKLAAFGYFIVFVLGVNDILYSKGIINSSYLLPLGIFGFVIIQAILMANKFAIAFTDVEKLSSELGTVNKNQEKIIAERSEELHKQSQDLRKYNDIKDKIFSIIAHDLRAPIASFRTVITLAEIGTKDDIEDIRRFFNDLKPNVDNLTLTIDNLFVWSQAQINGTIINPAIVNIKKETQSILHLYELVSRQKLITLATDVEEDILVKADPSHLNLILRNLINNALKFTNLNGQVTISAKRTAAHFVLIEVSDNGVGIDSEQLIHIFNPETHYTSYGTSNERGTGLGLLLCKEYVEKNGGSIHISSRKNIGTTIGFTLPEGKA